MRSELIIVGYPGEVHVGSHLRHGATGLGVSTMLCDSGQAFSGTRWQNKVNWWLLGRRPTKLSEFSRYVVETCRAARPRWLLSTGPAALDAGALGELEKLKVRRMNYVTDDPWNPAHRAAWFLKALPLYDHIFSPRHSIIPDLRQLGCRDVSYLPFAYAPEIHFPEPADTSGPDVIFAGGADRDRVPYMSALIQAGFNVALYGGYWDRYRDTAAHAHGMADAAKLRRAISAAKVALCLVRRANRDGHVMRTFEVPAIGTCMLTEDTGEHRQLFGADNETVVYFRDQQEMLIKLRWLLADEPARQRLATAARQLITGSRNTYADRLQFMLRHSGV